jgi:hypothetical protein
MSQTKPLTTALASVQSRQPMLCTQRTHQFTLQAQPNRRRANLPTNHVALHRVERQAIRIRHSKWECNLLNVSGSTPARHFCLRKHQMSHQDIDKEIAHLERVFGMISARDRFPLSYWHKRLNALPRAAMMPAQRQRIARLEATLRALGESRQTA